MGWKMGIFEVFHEFPCSKRACLAAPHLFPIPWHLECKPDPGRARSSSSFCYSTAASAAPAQQRLALPGTAWGSSRLIYQPALNEDAEIPSQSHCEAISPPDLLLHGRFRRNLLTQTVSPLLPQQSTRAAFLEWPPCHLTCHKELGTCSGQGCPGPPATQELDQNHPQGHGQEQPLLQTEPQHFWSGGQTS